MEKDQLLDFTNYRDMKYNVDIEIGANAGDEDTGQIAINDRPFIIQRITHQIVDAGVPFFLLLQDGLYRIDWSLYETKRFWKGSMPAALAAYGNARTGIWLDLPSPVSVVGNETIHVAVQNMVNRGEPITVHVEFQGIEQIGKVG